MKAAITAVMGSGMIYRETGSNQSPKDILKKINKPMYLKMDKRMFTAMSFAVIDTITKRLIFSNAGQMNPILKRNGGLRYLKVKGVRLPLGVQEEVKYGEATESLKSGDTIVFYTDGLTETMNVKNELFGFERLEERMKELANETSKQIVEELFKAAEGFANGAKQHDDMTVVVVKMI
jgi:sigma-B regulation protein RsbU (phosphoserine phosphatase)